MKARSAKRIPLWVRVLLLMAACIIPAVAGGATSTAAAMQPDMQVLTQKATAAVKHVANRVEEAIHELPKRLDPSPAPAPVPGDTVISSPEPLLGQGIDQSQILQTLTLDPAPVESKPLYTVTNMPMVNAGDRIVVVGGTSNPDAINAPMGNVFRPANAQIVNAHYPAELWPIGDMPYDESVAQGIAATQADLAAMGGCGTIVGHSQGARVSGDVAELANNSCVTAINLSDPRTPGTGIEINMPSILPGATMSGERDDTASHQVYICKEYDPICAFPQKIDPINLANALAGYFYVHGDYYEDVPQDQMVVKSDGKDTFVTIKNDTPPLIEAMRDAGIQSPELEAGIRMIVEPAEIGTSTEPVLTNPIIAEPLEAIGDAVASVLPTVDAPAPVVSPETRAWVDQGIQAAEDFANTYVSEAAPLVQQAAPVIEQVVAPIIEQVQTYFEPPAPTYTAPIQTYEPPAQTYTAPAPTFDTAVQQVNDFVSQVAPQAAPMVNDAVNAVADAASAFGIQLR